MARLKHYFVSIGFYFETYLLKMLQFEHITTNPKILGGKPIIKDTRISVEFILELLASGAAVKDIVEVYPHLSEEAVKEAILFLEDVGCQLY
jgi:uncharacterized protein (DUF433 family)